MSILAGAPHWKRRRLGDIAKTASGGTPKRTVPAYYGGDIPWVKSGELGDSTVYETEETISKAGLDASSAKIFPRGTLCIALYGATVGKLGILGLDAATNQAVCGIFLPDFVDTRFAYRFLESRRRELVELGKGGAQSNISQEIIRDLEFPVPAIEEQREIVAEIEKQFTRLEAGVAGLRRVQANLKRYRAAVLKTACEGKLVPTEAELARREGRSYETGAQLLDRILTERRQKWSGKGKYKEPAKPDITNLPLLPEGWVWGSLDEICTKITDGEHLSPKTVSEGVFLLSAKDVRENGVQLDDPKFVSSQDAEQFRKRCDPELGDVLVVSRGATIGRISVVQTTETFCLMGSVILLKSDKNALGKYLAVCLRDRRAKERLGIISGSTAQQAIYIRDIRTFALTLPPFAEQHRIVAEVERHLSIVEEFEAIVNANIQRTTRLRQSVLQQAFEGKLTDGGRFTDKHPTLELRLRGEGLQKSG